MTRFGLIGTNFITEWMLEGARRDPRFDALAVCSRSMETGRQFASRLDIPRVYDSLDAMLADPDINAVYIASPNALHCSQTIRCLEAGKAVLCEKAFASNAREAELMIETSRRSHRLLVEAMIPTLQPAFRVLRDNLSRVGVIRRYFASYCQYSSRYDNLKRGIVANAFKPELSNGALMDIGIYCLYPMVRLFGAPERISASCIKLSTGADGQGTVTATYGGMEGVAMYSKIVDSYLPTEIQGEDGTLTIDRINSPRRVTFTPRDKSRGSEILFDAGDDNPYYHEMTHFIDLYENGAIESPLNPLSTSLDTIRLVDEVRRQLDIRFPADNTRRP